MPTLPLSAAAKPSTPGTAAGSIRVLVIDDSVVMRQLITRMLTSDPTLSVIGTARDGVDALEKLQHLSPDVVTLDIEMPRLDGIGTLREIKRLHPLVRVIMCSSLTERGATITLDALLAGADDYVTKQHSGDMEAGAYELLRQELLTKLRELFKMRQDLPPSRQELSQVRTPAPAFGRVPTYSAVPIRTLPRRIGKPEAVVIGVSTGGPAALAEIVPMFPADFPVPIVIVQHMPPLFTKLLAERLSKLGRIPVVEATHGLQLQAGHASIAPGDFHIKLVRSGHHEVRVHLNQNPPENSCRPAVDVLFRSAAEVFGSAVISVVLTGMGQDGLLGVRALKEHNAPVIVQDAATSVVWGMPRAIADARLADFIVPLREIVPAIQRFL